MAQPRDIDGKALCELRRRGWSLHLIAFTAHYAAIMNSFLRGTASLGFNFRLVNCQARLTISKEVHRLARELDLKKERVYIQKGQIATPRPRGISDAT